MPEKRKDSKDRVLKDGESQRANGTYDYRYTDIHKKRRCIYAKSLTELRKKEEGLFFDQMQIDVQTEEKIDNLTGTANLKIKATNLFEVKIQGKVWYKFFSKPLLSGMPAGAGDRGKRNGRKLVHLFPLNPGQRGDRVQKKRKKAFSGGVWQ